MQFLIEFRDGGRKVKEEDGKVVLLVLSVLLSFLIEEYKKLFKLILKCVEGDKNGRRRGLCRDSVQILVLLRGNSELFPAF